jgi:hypothetical protein
MNVFVELIKYYVLIGMCLTAYLVYIFWSNNEISVVTPSFVLVNVLLWPWIWYGFITGSP